MTDTPSTILLTREQSTGSNTNLWGGYLIITQRQTEQAAKGWQTLPVTGGALITWTNYTTGNIGQCAHLVLTGTLSAPAVLTFPTYMNKMSVHNNAGAAVTVMCAAGTGVTIPNGRKIDVFCNGTDYFSDTPTWSADSITLTNPGDVVLYANLQLALSTLVAGSITGLVLNSAADTSAGYLSAKMSAATSGLLVATLATTNPGGNEVSTFTFDDRRNRRRSYFIGQV